MAELFSPEARETDRQIMAGQWGDVDDRAYWKLIGLPVPPTYVPAKVARPVVTKAQIAAEFDDGRTVLEIASRLNITPARVRSALKDL